MSRKPLFLERRSYRMRRMMDAVRLLPLVGLVLWMVPLLWPTPGPSANAASAATPDALRMSTALHYVFGVWLVLIAATFALWRRTRTPDETDPADTPEPAADSGRR